MISLTGFVPKFRTKTYSWEKNLQVTQESSIRFHFPTSSAKVLCFGSRNCPVKAYEIQLWSQMIIGAGAKGQRKPGLLGVVSKNSLELPPSVGPPTSAQALGL